MSEFIAAAQVLVRPDTTRFRTDLEAQLLAATKGITVPISVVAATSGLAGVTAATAATQSLQLVQREAQATTLGLASAEQVLNTEVARNVPLLRADATATDALGAAQTKAAAAAASHAGAEADIRKGALASLASLTGLRGAVLAASTGFLAATVATQAFFKSIQSAAEFERTLNVFRVTAGATAEEMEKVSEAAIALGEDISLPGVSASDAATAMQELARAGLSVEDALAGARGVLQLSAAAQIDQAQAAEFAASALNAFGLAGDQATRVADVLANAANSAQGSIEDFALAFRQSSAVANQVGLSLEETSAQLSILAQAGLRGSDAGTSLRVALLRLIAPTEAAQKIIKQLGIDLRDAQGNIRPDVFVQFGEATERFTKAQRDAAFAAVFGADAIRTVSIAAAAGRDDLIRATTAASEQGTAAELAAAQNAGLAGQAEAMKNQMAAASLEVGKVAGLLAGPLVTGLNQALSGVNILLKPLGLLADSLAKTGDRINALAGGRSFDPTTASASEFIEELRALREEMDQISGAQADKLRDAFGPKLQKVTKETIQALRGQRAELRALGADTSGIDALIKQLQASLGDLSGAANKVNLTPAQQQVKDLKATIAAAADLGLDTSKLKQNLADLEHEIQVSARNSAAAARDIPSLVEEAYSESTDTAVPKIRAASARLLGALDIALAQARGDEGGELSGLRGQEQRQQAFLDRILARPQTAANVDLATRAANNLDDTRDKIQAILDGQEADAKSAATEAKQKADDIAKAQLEATQGFLSSFDPKRQRIENQITAASLTERLSDDIKFEKQLVAFLKAQIDAIKRRIRRLGLHGAALRAARDAIRKLNQDIFNLTIDIQKDQQAQAKAIQDTILQKLDIRIQIAEARDDVAAQIKLRQQRLALITKELVKLKNAGKKNTLAWLELKLQQQQEIAAINDLKKTTDEKKNAQSSAFFSFLQTQQGFAANLLGNLIPGFATGGLVGNASPSGQGPAQGLKDPQDRVNIASQVAGARDRGVRPIQVDTTNQLLRQILRSLQGLNARSSHPEARYQDRVAGSNFDTIGGV